MSSNTKRRAVFLDRDGVINQSVIKAGKPYPPESLLHLHILPGVAEALTELSKAGFLLIVITNQPDVASGITSRETVETIHQYLASSLPIDDFYVCYHLDEHHCTCRKPAPGAIFSAAKKHQIDLSLSYMIGDRWRDIEAGNHAGCQTFFIDYAYMEKRPTGMNFTVNTLQEAAQIILGDVA